MADKDGKSEFVDTIGDATKQRYRRVMPRVKETVAKDAPKMGHWPPERLEQWRLENLTPWKIKPWKIKDWI